MEIIQKIPEKFSGKRLDSVAHNFFEDISRSKLQKNAQFFLEKEGEFFEMASKTRINEGETWKIVYVQDEEKHSHLVPWEKKLKVIQETNNWVVIEKPEGISVHPSVSEKTNQTIINALLFQFGEKNLSQKTSEIDGEMISRPGLVHRLDKGTSGVLLVAKNDKAHAYFQENWQQTKKIYYAVVRGVPSTKGKISSGITRDPENRQKMIASNKSSAKDALTYFERKDVSHDQKYSLLEIKIPTGRTHQIRVHLSSIGFSILGDTKYGGEGSDRMYLHAAELQFPEFKTGEMISVESNIPEKFLRFF